MKTRLFLFILLLLGVHGCRSNNSPPASQQAAGPAPGDSLAKLLRLLLDDPDPVAIAQAISCENGRLIRLYGPHKANSIAREVEDTIYDWRDKATLRRVDAKLANRVFDTDCGYPLGSDPARADSARRRP